MPINETALRAFREYRPQGSDVRAFDNELKLKPVDNGVSEISFFTEGYGRAKPYLRANPSKVEDTGRLAKILEATGPQLEALKNDPEAFGAFLLQNVAARKDYLQAPYTSPAFQGRTRFQYNNIIGQRVMQFLDEAKKLGAELYANSPAQRTRAEYHANTKTFDLLAREVIFDNFEINGYASFGHDAAFIHVYEDRLAQLERVPAVLRSAEQQNELKQLQGELDAIFREKYVYNNSNMYETDAEKSVGLCLIDANSRQRVSEVAETRDSIVPRFELLNVTVDGQNRAVYFDAAQNKHFFDGTGQEVPAALASQIRHTPLSDNDHWSLTFRRAKEGEHLRDGFRYDWDGDGWVSSSRISWTSWAGHCNDKANLENAGVVIPNDSPGVRDYLSATGTINHYNRDKLNEIPMSFSEMGSQMQEPRPGARPSMSLSNDQVGGARWDNYPDKLHLGNYSIPSRNRPNRLTIDRIVRDGKTYEAGLAFREHLVSEDGKSASANPLYHSTVEGDRIRLAAGGARVEGTAEFQVFNPQSGYPETRSQSIVIDFNQPADQPILLDTEMRDASRREMREISLDTKKRQLVSQLVRYEKKADGTGYERRVVGSEQRTPVATDDLLVSRETKLENPRLFFDFIKEALITARNFTSETALDEGVWNGSTKRLAEATVWRDDATGWARVSFEVDARFGGGAGAFLVKLKDNGEPDFFVPIQAAFDFLWRTDVAFAPEKDGLVSSTAFGRGVVTVQAGRVDTSAVSNLMEILHCGFNRREFLIQHEGARYICDTQEAFDRERAKLDALRKAALGEEPGPGPGPGGVGTLISEHGELTKGALKQHTLVAEADGELSIRLDTKSGDADLYVKKGGPATQSDNTASSTKGGTAADELKVPVTKGETIGVSVLGYAASSYDLTVTGPKAAAPDEPVSFKLTGAVEKGQQTPFEIEVKKTGKLDVLLKGTGDADVYLRIGQAPTTAAYDTRLYETGSNEQGSLAVEKGQKVYGFVHGYAPGSSGFELEIRQA